MHAAIYIKQKNEAEKIYIEEKLNKKIVAM